jgi:hypothetical protein
MNRRNFFALSVGSILASAAAAFVPKRSTPDRAAMLADFQLEYQAWLDKYAHLWPNLAQPAHQHNIVDPGHSHSVTDPGHLVSYPAPYLDHPAPYLNPTLVAAASCR